MKIVLSKKTYVSIRTSSSSAKIGCNIKSIANYRRFTAADFTLTRFSGGVISANLEFFDILSHVSSLITCIGGLIGLFRWIRSKIAPIDTPPKYFARLLKKQTWNHYEFAKVLNVEPDVSKKILKAFGFVWDKNSLLYQHTKDTDIRLLALSKFPRFENGLEKYKLPYPYK